MPTVNPQPSTVNCQLSTVNRLSNFLNRQTPRFNSQINYLPVAVDFHLQQTANLSILHELLNSFRLNNRLIINFLNHISSPQTGCYCGRIRNNANNSHTPIDCNSQAAVSIAVNLLLNLR